MERLISKISNKVKSTKSKKKRLNTLIKVWAKFKHQTIFLPAGELLSVENDV